MQSAKSDMDFIKYNLLPQLESMISVNIDINGFQ